MKDWTGNKTSVSATLGASSLTDKERADNDYYATPPRSLDAVIPYLNQQRMIWECACGEGSLSRRLKNLGFSVRESDSVVRSYKCEQLDFLDCPEKEWDGDILTNPPFAYALEFTQKALTLLGPGGKLFLYLRVQFLESKKRRKLFEEHPPKYVLVYSSQNPQCARNGDFSKPTGNAAMYCWFIWEKGWRGAPSILWI